MQHSKTAMVKFWLRERSWLPTFSIPADQIRRHLTRGMAKASSPTEADKPSPPSETAESGEKG